MRDSLGADTPQDFLIKSDIQSLQLSFSSPLSITNFINSLNPLLIFRESILLTRRDKPDELSPRGLIFSYFLIKFSHSPSFHFLNGFSKSRSRNNGLDVLSLLPFSHCFRVVVLSSHFRHQKPFNNWIYIFRRKTLLPPDSVNKGTTILEEIFGGTRDSFECHPLHHFSKSRYVCFRPVSHFCIMVHKI